MTVEKKEICILCKKEGDMFNRLVDPKNKRPPIYECPNCFQKTMNFTKAIEYNKLMRKIKQYLITGDKQILEDMEKEFYNALFQ